MKTLAQRNSVYELVIVVKRGICVEMIWTSDKNVANRLAHVVYDRQMGFSDKLENTFLIELTEIECKEMGLKKDCTSETFMFRTEKISKWLDTNLLPEELFDIRSILDEAIFKPRTIVLAKLNGRDCLIKIARKFSEKLWKPFADMGFVLEDYYNFTSNEGLRLFAFMNVSTKSNVEEYELSNVTVKRFKKLLSSVR